VLLNQHVFFHTFTSHFHGVHAQDLMQALQAMHLAAAACVGFHGDNKVRQKPLTDLV
jgi:hypothetical protein